MFTNYQWLIIGVIIACSCLVVYGSSSTNIMATDNNLAHVGRGWHRRGQWYPCSP